MWKSVDVLIEKLQRSRRWGVSIKVIPRRKLVINKVKKGNLRIKQGFYFLPTENVLVTTTIYIY